MKPGLQLTEEELNEIKLALFYERFCHQGTGGDRQLLLIAKLAHHVGIELQIERSKLTGVDAWDR